MLKTWGEGPLLFFGERKISNTYYSIKHQCCFNNIKWIIVSYSEYKIAIFDRFLEFKSYKRTCRLMHPHLSQHMYLEFCYLVRENWVLSRGFSAVSSPSPYDLFSFQHKGNKLPFKLFIWVCESKWFEEEVTRSPTSQVKKSTETLLQEKSHKGPTCSLTEDWVSFKEPKCILDLRSIYVYSMVT